MTDFYTQRLDEARQAKQARYTNSLPLQKPNTNNQVGTEASDVTTLAGKPTDPKEGPDMPDGMFSDMIRHYGKDNKFKAGLAEYATAIQALKTEMNGIDLPPEMMERKVASILDKFKQRASTQLQEAQQVKQMMPGLNNLMSGGGNV